MDIGKRIKEARLAKGWSQQEVADKVYVTRQTISKWELGKSIPDQASLSLLYQCLSLDDEVCQEIKATTLSKQHLVLIVLAVLVSPMVLLARRLLFKLGKREDKRFILCLHTVGIVLVALYMKTLIDTVFYFFLGILTVGYFLYQLYKLGLEKEDEQNNK